MSKVELHGRFKGSVTDEVTGVTFELEGFTTLTIEREIHSLPMGVSYDLTDMLTWRGSRMIVTLTRR